MPKGDDGTYDTDIRLYTPKKLESKELFITGYEEDTEFLNEKGFTATNFWSHGMYTEELVPMIPKLFGKYEKIYVIYNLIDRLNYGLDEQEALFDPGFPELGRTFLEELSKTCKEVIILNPDKTHWDGYVYCNPITLVINDASSDEEKENLWNELVQTSEKFESMDKLQEGLKQVEELASEKSLKEYLKFLKDNNISLIQGDVIR